jgi:hypothetical protein
VKVEVSKGNAHGRSVRQEQLSRSHRVTRELEAEVALQEHVERW